MLKLSFEALKDRKLRSGLTILMVTMGATLIVSLNGMSAGMNFFITEQFSTLAPNVILVTPAPLIQTGGGAPNPVRLDAATVSALKPIREVEEVIPIVQRVVKVKAGGSTMTLTAVGVDQTKIHHIRPDLALEVGTLVSPYDSVGILMGYEVMHPPGQGEPFARLGQTVTLEYSYVETRGETQRMVTEKRSFVVRGVLKDLGAGGVLNMNNAVFVSLSAANSFFKSGGEYDAIVVVSKSPELNEAVEEKIRERYGEDLGVTSPKAIVETIQSFISGFAVFFLSIAAVSLIVAAVGVVATLYTSVMERTREIGTLKALGFKNRSIMALFLGEAALIGVIGATAGLILGVTAGSMVLSSLLNLGPQAVDIPSIYLPRDLLFVWLFSVGISSIAGLYPAWRASKLDPVVALRKE